MVNAEQLIELLDFNLINKNFDNAVKLFDDEQYSKVILSHYPDVIQEVLLKHLTPDNYSTQPDLYAVCEAILKQLAEKCNQEGIFFEFLEIIDSAKDDDVFTSILKCLQVIVLNQSDKKSRALEYCLNSVEDFVFELPLPNELLKNIEDEEDKILENDDQIRRVLVMYMTLDLFYEPVVKQILSSPTENRIFRSNKFNRRNVLFCFILRLLGKPLSFLDLTHDEHNNKVTTYSRDVAGKMVKTLCDLHSDVFQLLHLVELRCRWPSKDKVDDDLVNIFLHHEKTPLKQLGMLFYLIIVEGLEAHRIPKVYNPTYIFQVGIYLANHMITADSAIIYKGLNLCLKMLDNITSSMNSDELDAEIHRTFCSNLVQLLMYSPSKRNRMTGLKVLRCYILKFDTHGRYLLIKNILLMSNHKGLMGYLTTLYKDMIFEDLNSGQLSEFTSGASLTHLILKSLCSLTGGIECDIADSSDQIISSLNFLIGLLMRDKNNSTGIRDVIPDLQKGFLGDLRSALNLSRAHYCAEIENVKSGKSLKTDEIMQGTEILNDNMGAERCDLGDLTNEKKLDMLHSALSTFDIIDFHLARVNEIINRAT